MRLMSFALTTQQMRQETKFETRRIGWKNARIGDRIIAIEKGQGIPKGGRVVPIGVIELVWVHREILGAVDRPACIREGFPNMMVWEFLEMFGKGRRDINEATRVTVLRFFHVRIARLTLPELQQYRRLARLP